MNHGIRCPRCGTLIGEGGRGKTSMPRKIEWDEEYVYPKHGWSLPEGGTVACHEATPEQLAVRTAAVEAQLAIEKDKRGRITAR